MEPKLRDKLGAGVLFLVLVGLVALIVLAGAGSIPGA
jgi:hypothetical protein